MTGKKVGILNPATLLREYAALFVREPPEKPILDLACGEGHNGVFLASQGLQVVLADQSSRALEHARKLADEQGVDVRLWQVDLEREDSDPLEGESYGGMLVFRYLHRPLIPCIRKALVKGSLLIYETYTTEQTRFGKPHNPAFLLKPGELLGWFADWTVLYHFEGRREAPPRAVAQMVCRKPR